MDFKIGTSPRNPRKHKQNLSKRAAKKPPTPVHTNGLKAPPKGPKALPKITLRDFHNNPEKKNDHSLQTLRAIAQTQLENPDAKSFMHPKTLCTTGGDYWKSLTGYKTYDASVFQVTLLDYIFLVEFVRKDKVVQRMRCFIRYNGRPVPADDDPNAEEPVAMGLAALLIEKITSVDDETKRMQYISGFQQAITAIRWGDQKGRLGNTFYCCVSRMLLSYQTYSETFQELLSQNLNLFLVAVSVHPSSLDAAGRKTLENYHDILTLFTENDSGLGAPKSLLAEDKEDCMDDEDEDENEPTDEPTPHGKLLVEAFKIRAETHRDVEKTRTDAHREIEQSRTKVQCASDQHLQDSWDDVVAVLSPNTQRRRRMETDNDNDDESRPAKRARP